MGGVLAVDVGAATTAVVMADGGGSVAAVREPGSGAMVWPAAVHRGDGGVLVGAAAERAKWSQPERHHRFAAQEWALTALFSAVRAAAGGAADHLVVVAAADVADVLAAAAAAGFGVVEVFPAAVAAAVDALTAPAGDVLVVDAGARCTVSLVRFENGPARVIAVATAFGRPVRRAADPDLAVVLGAAA